MQYTKDQVQKLEETYTKLYTNYIDERYGNGETTSQILYDLWMKSKSKPELSRKLEDALDTCSNVTWSVDENGKRNYIIETYLPKNLFQNKHQ